MGNAQLNGFICEQEPTADEFEDKDWTFVIENVSQQDGSVLSL